MAQVASLKDIEVDAVDMEIRARFPLEGNQGIKQGVGTAMERLDYLVELKGSADPDRVVELMEESDRHCFALNSLREAVPVSPGLRLNGEELPFNPPLPPELGQRTT